MRLRYTAEYHAAVGLSPNVLAQYAQAVFAS